jgi:hypothetical protein
MPDFKEQLQQIAELRTRCRQGDESLYRNRIALQRVKQDLGRAQQKQTVGQPNRDAGIARLRTEMAKIDARLASLREEARQVAQSLAQIADQTKLVDQLRHNQAAVRRQVEALRQKIAELRQQEPAQEAKVKLLEGEVARAQLVQADLAYSLRKASDTLHQLQSHEAQLRQKQTALQASIEADRGKLRVSQEKLTGLLRPTFHDPQALGARTKELETTIARHQTGLTACRDKLGAAIGGLYQQDPHPREALRNLDDRTPFLLFPVRIETIFVPSESPEGNTELWVRVYPDDIAVHTHEKLLTDREVVAGELYWVELVVAEYLRAERDHHRASAWRHMVELFGGQRASWVARETKPSGWDTLVAAGAAQTLPDFLLSMDPKFFDNLLATSLSADIRAALKKAVAANDGDAFSLLADDQDWSVLVNDAVRTQIKGFPAHDLTKTDAWTRAPRTNVLPDRFVLLLYDTETAVPRQIPGAVIPDTVLLGPDPLDAKASFTPKDNALTLAGPFDWISDFDKAVAQGLGFRVPLTGEEAVHGFARVYVLGVMLSADAGFSATLLEELIDNHQFGPEGLSIVPQGTPTNHTERNGTGYSDSDPYDDLEFFSQTDPPAFNPTNPDPRKSQTDGRLLADALGVSYSPLQTVLRADRTDVIEAAAMNTAMFPTTLGYWLHTWMSPVIDDQAARQTRSFFNRFVSGRGPLPSIRVGNQPYGILVTSDLSRWKYPQPEGGAIRLHIFDEETTFLKNLYALLSKLEETWNDIAAGLLFIGKQGSDSSEILMNVLGLQPTSVEFFQRIGFSYEYLRGLPSFQPDHKSYNNELESLIQSMPGVTRQYLHFLGVEEDLATLHALVGIHILWQHYTTPLDALNLVENVPLSESRPLVHDYIDWLAKADSTEKIMQEAFGGPVPTALLYAMLRNALLLQLHRGSYEWLVGRSEFDPSLQQAVRPTTLPGVHASTPTLSKYEVMTTKVSAVAPAHPVPASTVADWIWRGPTEPDVEAAFVKEQKAALSLLSGVSTASLERCFVEHLDCCNYRLDAWQTGLIAQRLQAERAVSGTGDDRRTGIYLGAFGWVENLTPARKVFINRDSLPAILRPNDGHPVLEEDDVVATQAVGSRRGGFMHAPSLSHASAAAVLRSAYLSHANPAEAEMFSVNLSSERVRRAEFVLEGMRNGQPIEALLGYQFERGLHDRTSESAARGDAPVLELNEFVFLYRQAFPFKSREIVQAGTGAPSETVPAYNVVNGLQLSEASLTPANGYGLGAVLTVPELPNANQGNAILEERDRLLDTLDAVKDLLMAENAYQLVRGNFDRVAAVSLAQKEAHIPPELEVINTPRGSEFTFTNRVTLHFDDLDPILPENNPWAPTLLTPRATAEPGMNQWLGHVLGSSPERVSCNVFWVERAESGATRHDPHLVTLADLKIQPIDFVWMTSLSPDKTGGATELETRIAYVYRHDYKIGNDKTVQIEFDPAVAAGDKTFAQLFPLVRQLHALLSGSRALHAGDFLPATGAKVKALPVDKDNPKGYDLGDLRSRVQSSVNTLVALADTLDGVAAPTVGLVFVNDPENPTDDEAFSGHLGAAFDKLEAAKLTFADAKEVKVTFLVSDAEILHQNLRAIANFGIADAFPPEADLSGDDAKAALLDRAYRVARRLRRNDPKDGVLDRVTDALNQATPGKTTDQQATILLGAAKALFADSFSCLPKFVCSNEIDIATADADRTQLLGYALSKNPGMTGEDVVADWLQGLARVRPQLHRLEIVQTLSDAINEVQIEVRPVQVPYRAQDSWLAVEFPDMDPVIKDKPFGISRDTLSIAAHGNSAFKPGTRQTGVLLDDWTEEIPTAQEITGIAFRYNRPNATPPQTLLLVVTPEETGSWNWDNLVGALTDTLARAKRRAVEPEQLEQKGSVWNALAPALISEFSAQQKADVSLDLMGVLRYAPLNEFYAAKIGTS